MTAAFTHRLLTHLQFGEGSVGTAPLCSAQCPLRAHPGGRVGGGASRAGLWNLLDAGLLPCLLHHAGCSGDPIRLCQPDLCTGSSCGRPERRVLGVQGGGDSSPGGRSHCTSPALLAERPPRSSPGPAGGRAFPPAGREECQPLGACGHFKPQDPLG